MNDLKERITEGLHHCGMCGQQAVEINSRGQWICTACLNEVRPDYMSVLRMEAAARIEELEAENFALAAQQCLFSDGSGLCGDEWGHQYCAMKRRAEAAEAKLATARNDALEEAAVAVCRVVFFSERDSDLNAYVCQCASNAIRALKSTNQP